jgi:hypothetical protein
MPMPSLKHIFTSFATAMGALLLANCTMGTPQSRIDGNYSLYESLPAKHQELVSQGKIAKGMSKSAVFLALGNPSRKSEGFRDDTHFERWNYTRLQPRYYNSFQTIYGHGSSRRGHGRHYHGFAFAPTIEYAPYRSASVLFLRKVVDSWERLEPPRY